MKDAAAETAKKTATKLAKSTDAAASGIDPNVKETALDRRYGAIGISAVVAALRYQGGAKNPAYAPVATPGYGAAEEAA